MMGHRQVEQAALFYELSLEKHAPADHLLRPIDRFVPSKSMTSRPMAMRRIEQRSSNRKLTSARSAAERRRVRWARAVRLKLRQRLVNGIDERSVAGEPDIGRD